MFRLGIKLASMVLLSEGPGLGTGAEGATASTAVNVTSNSDLPGDKQFGNLTGSLMHVALYGCIVALMMGAVAWAGGVGMHNYKSATAGKKIVGASLAGALIVGGAGPLVDFFFKTGQQFSGTVTQ